MYSWFVFLHVLGVMGFLVSHGVSIGVAFELRTEHNLDRIRSLLDLSGKFVGIMNASLLVLLIAGIVSGFMGSWWGKIWIWISILLFIGIATYMSMAVTTYYHRVRKAAGLQYMVKYKPYPPAEPASTEEIEQLLSQSNPILLAVIGLGGLAIITWLMMFKPF
jgi:hypothetical protein